MRPLLSLLFAYTCLPSAFADGTIAWPVPPVPAGTNSATLAEPRIDWMNRFQQRMDDARKQPSIDIIFDGDSITDFWVGNGKAIWVQKYVPLHAFDFGVSGDRTENLLWRLQNHQVDGLHPKLVLLMIGTNNIGGNTPEQVADGVKADVAEYRHLLPDAVILLQAIFPRAEKATDPARDKIKAINTIISQLADGTHVLYIDFGDKFLQPDGTLTRDIMPDFLHPSLKGYQIWADAIQPMIDKYVPATTDASTTPAPPAK